MISSFDPASFRDPAGHVFSLQNRIFRYVHAASAQDWRDLCNSGLFAHLQEKGFVVATREVQVDPALDPDLPSNSVVLEHEKVPFISYPYEWSFEMLRDAALLHLELMETCLGKDFILKDSSAYNIQFIGTRAVFIDILSFTRPKPGEPWLGYNQFCKMFLFPLMLQAYKEVPFQSWLRSELEGIDPVIFSKLMGTRDLFRPGVLMHVWLQAVLQNKFAAKKRSIRTEIRSAQFSKAAILNNVRGLSRLIRKLDTKPPSGHTWVNYSDQHSYRTEAFEKKEQFIREAIGKKRYRLVWDLGCNTGHFTELAAPFADYLVAMDADPFSIDRLFSLVKEKKIPNVLGLVMNLANPSPDHGWRACERQALVSRGRPDMIFCLALVHHMAITENIPVRSFLQWLSQLGGELIIEFVSRQDTMVQQLLLNKEDTYEDYHQSHFESCLQELFSIRTHLMLPGGTRFLYWATPKENSVARAGQRTQSEASSFEIPR